MAKRPQSSKEPHPAKLTVEDMKRAIPRLEKRIAELESFQPQEMSSADELEEAAEPIRSSIQTAITNTFGTGTVEANKYYRASVVTANLTLRLGGAPNTLQEYKEGYLKSKRRAILLLREAVENIKEQLADAEGSEVEEKIAASSEAYNRKVFVVHGHDDAARLDVTRFLETLDFEPIVLNEQPSRSLTIIEKIEENSDVGFAVVLLTPDDVGSKNGDEPKPRARQNVILELGYFIGKHGRKNVCVLKKADVEFPSDFIGPIWVDLDVGGAWKVKLGTELRAAGLEVDLNKLIG